MIRFVFTYGQNATLVLLSGDCNYAPYLSDFRHRYGVYIILISQKNVSHSVKICAHEYYDASILTNNLPLRKLMKVNPVQILISSLPEELTEDEIKSELKQLIINTGAKIMSINKENKTAMIVLPNADLAYKAKARIGSEIIGSSQISAEIWPSNTSPAEDLGDIVQSVPGPSRMNIDLSAESAGSEGTASYDSQDDEIKEGTQKPPKRPREN